MKHKAALSRNYYPQKKDGRPNMKLFDFSWGGGRCPTNLIAFNEIPGQWVIVPGEKNRKFIKWAKMPKSHTTQGGI